MSVKNIGTAKRREVLLGAQRKKMLPVMVLLSSQKSAVVPIRQIARIGMNLRGSISFTRQKNLQNDTVYQHIRFETGYIFIVIMTNRKRISHMKNRKRVYLKLLGGIKLWHLKR